MQYLKSKRKSIGLRHVLTVRHDLLRSMDAVMCMSLPHVEACQNWRENDKISFGEAAATTTTTAAAAATVMNNSKADTLNLQAISLQRYGTP